MAEASSSSASFDLHVLGTPPAFVLSQDQTLNKLYFSSRFRKLKPSLLKMNQNLGFISSKRISFPSPKGEGIEKPFSLVLKFCLSFLQCLIFKVHPCSLVLGSVRNFLSGLPYFSTSNRFCQELFLNFFKFFFSASGGPCRSLSRQLA